MEMPGCSLCMGNQARVQTGATVVSTSTRNFPNRLGEGANVYPGLGRAGRRCRDHRPDPDRRRVPGVRQDLDATAADIYRYLNFNEIASYTKKADAVILQQAV